jgi:DNA helicase-2/ATP-dependent DNA helicase PcrA
VSLTEKDWREEQQRVDVAVTKIGEQILRLEKETGKIKIDVVNIRKHFWDDVTVNLSDPGEAAETVYSIRQQAEVLAERERSYRSSANALKKFTRLVESPWFGRIDFTEPGATESERIYLGIASFQDEDGNFLVYDWRAPISSLYYDYPPGPASYQTPNGKITGNIELKRQYLIRGRHIRQMFDTGVTIGDELLREVLSRSSDAQMKSIVATIQKEQNRIIRNDKSRMLIVQGAAGSGKTSAALQRIAYLLYKQRETLTSDQIVLFSPNPLFNSYISSVLPELGEENMQQTTFQQYLEHRLGKDFQLEDPFTQIEHVLTCEGTPSHEARVSGIRYKSSTSFLKAIHAYKERLEQEGMIFNPVKFRGLEIVTAERIKERFYAFDPGIRLANRIEMLRDWLLEELAAFEETEWHMEWVEEEIQLLEPEDYLRAHKELRRQQRGKGMTFDDFEKEKEFLARMVVQERLKPLRKWIKQLRFVDVPALYRQLFKNDRLFAEIAGGAGFPEHWPEICRQTQEKLERRELAYEDATPFLYLKELVQGFRIYTSVRHVFVDEAQDCSPFQLEFLKRMFPRARMTALGDLNQTIYPHSSALNDLAPLIGLYGPEETELIRLSRTYRSTREIVEFTRGMIPGGKEIIPFNRRGDKPRIMMAADRDRLHAGIAAAINQLRAEGFESVAVICKTAKESADAFESLHKRLPLHLITKHSPSFEKGTLVIPVYLAKGVEFDAVIIYNGSKEQYGREDERKLFYTACTRAMHLLHIFVLGQPSPFITEQPPHTHVLESVHM